MDSQPITISIYVLIDPRDGEIRYVGKSKDPKRRLMGHLSNLDTSYRGRWIGKLLRIGLEPRMDIVQEVPEAFWAEAERYWIAYFRTIGCRLTNGTDGGEGGSGHVMSDEQKAQVSAVHKGKTISEENKRAVSAAATKRWAEWRANGMSASAETRAKVSAANKGRPASEESKRQTSLRWKGVSKSPEQRAKMSLAHKGKAHPWAAENARRMAEANRGKKQSPETIRKRLATQAANRSAQQKALCQSST